MSELLTQPSLQVRFKEHVVSLISEHTFIKATLLPTLCGDFFAKGMTTDNYQKWVRELLIERKMFEHEYFKMDNTDRVKSLFVDPSVVFPASKAVTHAG